MPQSTCQTSIRHLAVIPDGNGRWARRRGLPRSAGHLEGAKTARRIVEHAARLGLDALTLFAFSADNWKRPRGEVDGLLDLFERYLGEERRRHEATGVRLEVIGRRDRLPPSLVRAIADAERATRSHAGMRLRIAIDYSAREVIRRAASKRYAELDFELAIARASHAAPGTPAVDLVVRTSGEMRLSDFLLWESAYAELYFTPLLWPEFGPGELDRALDAYRGRQRRFGALPERLSA